MGPPNSQVFVERPGRVALRLTVVTCQLARSVTRGSYCPTIPHQLDGAELGPPSKFGPRRLYLLDTKHCSSALVGAAALQRVLNSIHQQTLCKNTPSPFVLVDVCLQAHIRKSILGGRNLSIVCLMRFFPNALATGTRPQAPTPPPQPRPTISKLICCCLCRSGAKVSPGNVNIEIGGAGGKHRCEKLYLSFALGDRRDIIHCNPLPRNSANAQNIDEHQTRWQH